MNRDRKCRLQFSTYPKQIDVLARDDENVFVVDCAFSESQGVVNVRNKLNELVGLRGDIQQALRTQWGRSIGKLNLLVVISSQQKRSKDEQFVLEKKDKNVHLWSARELKYIEDLVKHVGRAAKYQLYSVIFAGRKQKHLKKEYMALRGKMGGRRFYSFMMPSSELLRYAYVHHRKLTAIVEASQAYQRMLRSTKIKQIRRFLDEEERYFPNTVIVNFSRKLQWKQKAPKDEHGIAMGAVVLPEYYGCAWVIDGQHRVYGAAAAERQPVLPVLAFEGMDESEQANLFVEINEKQKKVPSDLLWDLCTDIYRESTEPKQVFLRQISETAKIIEASGPLSGYIDIPSDPKPRRVKLKLTTVCATLQKYLPWAHLKHPRDEAKNAENAARVVDSYFSVLRSLWPDDWNKGNAGVLLTNNGFGVFVMVLQDIINHINYLRPQLLAPNKTKELEQALRDSYLTPVIEYLKTEKKMQKAIRSQGGRGTQSDNAGYLDVKIQEFVPDFAPPRIGALPSTLTPKEPPAMPKIVRKAGQAEAHLRAFVTERLVQEYGSEKWWKIGVPGDLKAKADDRWASEVKLKPYLQGEPRVNEKKFEYFGLGELMNIVLYKDNWDGVFEPVFKDKSNLQRRIREVKALRDPSAHERSIDDLDVADGISGLLWLANTLGERGLNPYV